MQQCPFCCWAAGFAARVPEAAVCGTFFPEPGAAAYVADYLAGSGLTLTDRDNRQVTPAEAVRGQTVIATGTCPLPAAPRANS